MRPNFSCRHRMPLRMHCQTKNVIVVFGVENLGVVGAVVNDPHPCHVVDDVPRGISVAKVVAAVPPSVAVDKLGGKGGC